MKAVLTRLQPHWDWRAAGNFMCGGAGAGGEGDTLVLDHCARCGGVWFEAGETHSTASLEELVTRM